MARIEEYKPPQSLNLPDMSPTSAGGMRLSSAAANASAGRLSMPRAREGLIDVSPVTGAMDKLGRVVAEKEYQRNRLDADKKIDELTERLLIAEQELAKDLDTNTLEALHSNLPNETKAILDSIPSGRAKTYAQERLQALEGKFRARAVGQQAIKEAQKTVLGVNETIDRKQALFLKDPTGESLLDKLTELRTHKEELTEAKSITPQMSEAIEQSIEKFQDGGIEMLIQNSPNDAKATLEVLAELGRVDSKDMARYERMLESSYSKANQELRQEAVTQADMAINYLVENGELPATFNKELFDTVANPAMKRSFQEEQIAGKALYQFGQEMSKASLRKGSSGNITFNEALMGMQERYKAHPTTEMRHALGSAKLAYKTMLDKLAESPATIIRSQNPEIDNALKSAEQLTDPVMRKQERKPALDALVRVAQDQYGLHKYNTPLMTKEEATSSALTLVNGSSKERYLELKRLAIDYPDEYLGTVLLQMAQQKDNPIPVDLVILGDYVDNDVMLEGWLAAITRPDAYYDKENVGETAKQINEMEANGDVAGYVRSLYNRFSGSRVGNEVSARFGHVVKAIAKDKLVSNPSLSANSAYKQAVDELITQKTELTTINGFTVPMPRATADKIKAFSPPRLKQMSRSAQTVLNDFTNLRGGVYAKDTPVLDAVISRLSHANIADLNTDVRDSLEDILTEVELQPVNEGLLLTYRGVGSMAMPMTHTGTVSKDEVTGDPVFEPLVLTWEELELIDDELRPADTARLPIQSAGQSQMFGIFAPGRQ